LGELHYQGATPLEEDEGLTMPNYDPKDIFFLQLVHVVLKIRGDLIGMDGHVGLSVSEDDAIDCVPDSLFTFLNLVYGGQDILNQDGNPEDSKSTKQTKILSVCQDIVYGVSEGRKWTPKHIGLSCTLHQMTRSKQLVNLFHSAGHTFNYHEKGKIVKADRNTLHRIVTAFKAGREVNMSEILKHELMPVPIAIAETNGSLRSGNKSLLLDILLKNVDTNGVIDFNDRSALIIDGQFLVQSLKHQGLRTFGEYADMYVGVVLRKCVRFRRIDVVFDRYRTQSIKSGTRKKNIKIRTAN
jgi:hypothetical protein